MHTPFYAARGLRRFSTLALVLGLALSLHADDSAPPALIPNVFVVNVQKGAVSTKNTSTRIASVTDDRAQPSTTSGPSRPPSDPRSTGRLPSTGQPVTATAATGQSMSTAGTVHYLITLRNGSKFPATGLVVQYTFYTKTMSNGPQVGDPQIAAVNFTSDPIDIDAGKNYELESQPINIALSQSQTSSRQYQVISSSGNTDTVSSRSRRTQLATTSSQTSVLGWHIEILLDGKVLGHPVNYPDNLQTILKNYHFSQ